MPQDRDGWRDALGEQGPLVLALVPVVLLPFLVGGVHPEVVAGALAFELAALGWLVWHRGRRGKALIVPWMAAPFLIGAIVTLLQIAPLPRGLVEILSPDAVERVEWMAALLPAAARADIAPRLSLDPPESAFALVRLLGALALFLVVVDAARHRRARSTVFRALLVCALGMFTVALAHRLLNISGAWGAFTMKSTFFYAPMVNPNQLGRVFGALSLALVARALVVRSRTETLWLVAGAVVSGAGLFLTYSRGAMVAFAIGGALLSVMLWRAGRAGTEPSAGSAAGSSSVPAALAQLVLVAALGVGLYLAREKVLSEAGSLSTERIESSKVAIYRPALSLLDTFATTGVGNNAFGVAFSERASADMFGGNITFTHPENIVVGTLVEHGAFFGGVLVFLAAVIGLNLFFRLRARDQLVAFPALAFLLVGDLLDFVLESGAGIYLAATLLAVCVASLDLQTARRVPPRPAAIAVALLMVLALPLSWWATTQWRPRLDDDIASAHGDARIAAIDRALAAHPADGHYAYLRAVAAREQSRDPSLALRWANRALVLWPWHRGAHLEAARALVGIGRRDQALYEFKAAWLSGAPDQRIPDEVARLTRDVAERRAALPEGVDALSTIAAQLVKESRGPEALATLDDAIALAEVGGGRAGDGTALRHRAVMLALQLGDVRGARARVAPLLPQGGSVMPGVDVLVLALRVTEAEHDLGSAFAESERYVEKSAEKAPLLRWRLDAATRLGRLDAAHAALNTLRQRTSGSAEAESLDRQEAALHAAAGDRGRQLRILERLAIRNPNDLALQLEVAELELLLGMLAPARQSWGRAARIAPGDARVSGLATRIEAAEGKARERRIMGTP